MQNKIQTNKTNLRTQILKLRNTLTDDQIKEFSAIIQNKIIKLKVFKRAKIIHIYKHFGSEVMTDRLIEAGFIANKKIIVTQTLPKGQMRHFEIFAHTAFEQDRFGISYPSEDFINNCIHFDICKLDKDDLVIVPLVAFDIQNNRIGYGGGYYDRFLSQLNPKVTKIGLAFGCQQVTKIMSQDFDVILDRIITNEQSN